MPSKIELLQEAHKRGILPPDKTALYDEAVKRGLIEPVYEDLPVGTPTKEFARVGLPIAGDVFMGAIAPGAGKGASLGAKGLALAIRSVMSGAGGGAGSVIGQQISEGKIDPAEVARETTIGALGEPALTGLGAALKGSAKHIGKPLLEFATGLTPHARKLEKRVAKGVRAEQKALMATETDAAEKFIHDIAPDVVRKQDVPIDDLDLKVVQAKQETGVIYDRYEEALDAYAKQNEGIIHMDDTAQLLNDMRGGPISKTILSDTHFPKGAVETGRPVRFHYSHNKERAANMGSMFAQDIEPSGKYVAAVSGGAENRELRKIFDFGVADFKNPLVLEHKTPRHGGWKTDLSDMYDGKTGKELSNAIKNDGFDGIVTVDNGRISESVILGKEIILPKGSRLQKDNAMFKKFGLSISNREELMPLLRDIEGLGPKSIKYVLATMNKNYMKLSPTKREMLDKLKEAILNDIGRAAGAKNLKQEADLLFKETKRFLDIKKLFDVGKWTDRSGRHYIQPYAIAKKIYAEKKKILDPKFGSPELWPKLKELADHYSEIYPRFQKIEVDDAFDLIKAWQTVSPRSQKILGTIAGIGKFGAKATGKAALHLGGQAVNFPNEVDF